MVLIPTSAGKRNLAIGRGPMERDSNDSFGEALAGTYGVCPELFGDSPPWLRRQRRDDVSKSISARVAREVTSRRGVRCLVATAS